MLDEIMFAFIFFDKAAIKSEVCRLEGMLNGSDVKLMVNFCSIGSSGFCNSGKFNEIARVFRSATRQRIRSKISSLFDRMQSYKGASLFFEELLLICKSSFEFVFQA